MELIVFDKATDFLSVTRAALEKEESANGLPFGVALRLVRSDGSAGAYLAAVLDGSDVVLSAIIEPPHNLLVFRLAPSEMAGAMSLLCGNLKSGGVTVPGVLGAERLAALFAQEWTRIMPVKARASMSQRVYELRRVNPAAVSAPGRFRPAEPRDLDLLANWHGEALRTQLATQIRGGEVGLWEDGRPVSCAAQTRPTSHGVAINLVFTPEEFRRKGYATACVASLCRRLLGSGWQFCCLHADLANPTSNSIYRKVGFVPVCDFQEYRFEWTPNRAQELLADRGEDST